MDDHFILDEDPSEEDPFDDLNQNEKDELYKILVKHSHLDSDPEHMAPIYREPMFVEPKDLKINEKNIP